MFTNRAEAGRELAKQLMVYRDKNAVILALPRGGVVVGFEIARALSLPLDIVAVRKIGHPISPEYAIGAVDEKGTRILNEMEAAAVDPKWLDAEIEREMREAKRRSIAYREGRAPAPVAGKVALIVDDGIATGLSMRLAVHAVKARNAKKIIIAVPVAPPDSLAILKDEGADEVIVLEPPEEFMGAVGAHYVHFEQVQDNEVIQLLKAAQ